MPTRVTNPRNDSPEAMAEYQIGSLPLGTCVEILNCDDVLVYRGYVMELRTQWGYVKVLPTCEGDGNFIGSGETGTLARIYSMSDVHYVQAECGVRAVYEDQELRQELMIQQEAGTKRGALDTKGASRTSDRVVSLLPVVSLVVIPPEEAE